MAKKITRIKASDSPRPKESEPTVKQKVSVKDKKVEQKKQDEVKEAVRQEKKAAKVAEQAETKKVFVLFRPFVAFFRYLKNAFIEIRQVRWPGRKDTWKMVLAVFVYTFLFIALITLLDMFFTWLFSLIMGN